LATELVRWKVWRVEGQPDANLQEAQAIQALAMALVGLLDNVHGSPASIHTELAKAVALLGYTLHASGAGPGLQESWATAEAHGDDALFLRRHGLRFEEDAQADDPWLEP
jgi:hypothetical protein